MPDSSEKIRILILTSATGGGHNARAFAIKDWIEKQRNNILTPALTWRKDRTLPTYLLPFLQLEALDRLVQDDQCYLKIVEEARQWVEVHYDAHKNANLLLSHFNKGSL